MKTDLKRLRTVIDSLDQRLVAMLNRRASMALKIGALKNAGRHDIYVPSREKQVFENVRAANKGPLPNPCLLHIYREIMSSSLALERCIRVAFLGPESTFTHQAARARFGGSVDYRACETITDVFDAVCKEQADYGVVPIENSTDGAVTHTFDQFVGTPLKICSEIYLPISQNLMARTPARSLRRIYSKGEVFGQCRNWLRAECPKAELIPVSSTARAAEMASKERGTAAIAGLLAAEMYSLKVLARDIQDMRGNITRFLVIGRSCPPSSGDDKTSLMFAIKHKAGSLHQALQAFKTYGINMTKIESRPSKQKAWEYFFFVDVEGHAEDAKVRKALHVLETHCVHLAVLGAYPKAPEGAG